MHAGGVQGEWDMLFILCVMYTHTDVVNKLLHHMLKDSALETKPTVMEEIRHCSVTALNYSFQAYFEVSTIL